MILKVKIESDRIILAPSGELVIMLESDPSLRKLYNLKEYGEIILVTGDVFIITSNIKASFHGVNAIANFVILPMGVNKESVQATLVCLASEAYTELGGNGEDFLPEVNVFAGLGESSGCVTLKSIVNGKEWEMFIKPSKDVELAFSGKTFKP